MTRVVKVHIDKGQNFFVLRGLSYEAIIRNYQKYRVIARNFEIMDHFEAKDFYINLCYGQY